MFDLLFKFLSQVHQMSLFYAFFFFKEEPKVGDKKGNCMPDHISILVKYKVETDSFQKRCTKSLFFRVISHF
jgi:hypothetical protein